jgi:hypoxanthine phosphoribosyltransferase
LIEKRVLLVDDVLDSGETALAAIELLRGREPAVLKFATMQVKTYSQFKPDFFVEEKSNWLFYPWMSEGEFQAMNRRLAGQS